MTSSLISTFSRTVDAQLHTPVYTMHKYFARRPWNVFSELIAHYSSPGDIVLDPFAGGGVTVVESLKLKRKVIGVDVNPLAAYVAKMEVSPIDLSKLESVLLNLNESLADEIRSLYSTKCAKCKCPAIADWTEWDEERRLPLRVKYNCVRCGSIVKSASKSDRELAEEINSDFLKIIHKRKLWFPQTRIPRGDKSDSLIVHGLRSFDELFTKRNLLALSILLDAINRVHDDDCREFLKFTFSSSLKWASRLSHLRGKIVEGWAMHAYWVYPKSLEINVWNTFRRRAKAVLRGKRYSSRYVGDYCKFAGNFKELASGDATCMILQSSSAKLPLPDDSVDVVITDPPYGGNVNYGELSDFWWVWLNEGETSEKKDEAVINKTQKKSLETYEAILSRVFAECYRTLKSQGCLVSTFNSRDIRVVASFVKGAAGAGFVLHPEGLLYQKPIRPYATTFHAMQIGAFVGDFIFTFMKSGIKRSHWRSSDLTRQVDALIAEGFGDESFEPDLRVRAYRLLIPFLAEHARSDRGACDAAVDYFERRIRERDRQFSELRRNLVEVRRRKFQRKA